MRWRLPPEVVETLHHGETRLLAHSKGLSTRATAWGVPPADSCGEGSEEVWHVLDGVAPWGTVGPRCDTRTSEAAPPSHDQLLTVALALWGQELRRGFEVLGGQEVKGSEWTVLAWPRTFEGRSKVY